MALTRTENDLNGVPYNYSLNLKFEKVSNKQPKKLDIVFAMCLGFKDSPSVHEMETVIQTALAEAKGLVGEENVTHNIYFHYKESPSGEIPLSESFPKEHPEFFKQPFVDGHHCRFEDYRETEEWKKAKVAFDKLEDSNKEMFQHHILKDVQVWQKRESSKKIESDPEKFSQYLRQLAIDRMSFVMRHGRIQFDNAFRQDSRHKKPGRINKDAGEATTRTVIIDKHSNLAKLFIATHQFANYPHELAIDLGYDYVAIQSKEALSQAKQIERFSIPPIDNSSIKVVPVAINNTMAASNQTPRNGGSPISQKLLDRRYNQAASVVAANRVCVLNLAAVTKEIIVRLTQLGFIDIAASFTVDSSMRLASEMQSKGGVSHGYLSQHARFFSIAGSRLTTSATKSLKM